MIPRWITIVSDEDSDIQANYEYNVRRYIAGFANHYKLDWILEIFWGNELRIGDAYSEITVILIIFTDQQIYDMFLEKWVFKDTYLNNKPPFPKLWITE